MPSTDKDIIIVTIRGTEEERSKLRAAAAREGVSLNIMVRKRLGMRVRDKRRKDIREIGK